MALEDTGLVVGRPSGLCPRHGTPNIMVNEHAECLHCNKEIARAQAEPVGVVGVEDPGDEAMKTLKTAENEDPRVGLAGHMGVSKSLLRTGDQPKQAIRAATPAVAVKGGTFEEQVGSAIATLKACPMPENLKSFKAVAKARAILEKLLTPEEGI